MNFIKEWNVPLRLTWLRLILSAREERGNTTLIADLEIRAKRLAPRQKHCLHKTDFQHRVRRELDSECAGQENKR